MYQADMFYPIMIMSTIFDVLLFIGWSLLTGSYDLGRECVKFFRLAEKDIRPLDDSSFTGINFVSGCWLRAPEDTFIAGSGNL